VLEESHSSSVVSCKDYFHLGINPLVAVTDNPAFRLQTNHSFNETRNIMLMLMSRNRNCEPGNISISTSITKASENSSQSCSD